ncbi:hypothetical protein B0H14DRAFT_2608188 [Mycena olivaceomarginata]|nr:hypothetical protein B0H14DRAFT_2608188 [Mycena olivaceomarginata]
MDATTVLGSKVNEGESAQAQLQAPKRVVNGGAPIAKWALRGRKKPQNRLHERSTRQHHMPPGQARGWGLDENSPGPAKTALWGVKSPKTGCASAVPGNTICPLGKPEDRGWMGAAQGPRKGPCCASAVPGNTICPLGKPEYRGWMGAAQGLQKGPRGV